MRYPVLVIEDLRMIRRPERLVQVNGSLLADLIQPISEGRAPIPLYALQTLSEGGGYRFSGTFSSQAG